MLQVLSWIQSNPVVAVLVGLLIIAIFGWWMSHRQANRLKWAADVITLDELVRQAADQALTRRVEATEAAAKAKQAADQQFCEARADCASYRRASRILFR